MSARVGGKKLRILCLHGMRTSGKILSMQTAAMQYHTPFIFEFIDAPYPATGPPDRGISMFYPDHAYFEWFLRGANDTYIGLDESKEFLAQYLRQNGPFDGLLGFSQGVSMVTRLAEMQRIGHPSLRGIQPFNFVVLMGGVPPGDLTPEQQLDLPSLHILGSADPLREKGIQVLEYYTAATRSVLEHGEGHNIPSMGTGLYPLISDWANNLTVGSSSESI